jgi:hypothetical protein
VSNSGNPQGVVALKSQVCYNSAVSAFRKKKGTKTNECSTSPAERRGLCFIAILGSFRERVALHLLNSNYYRNTLFPAVESGRTHIYIHLEPAPLSAIGNDFENRISKIEIREKQGARVQTLNLRNKINIKIKTRRREHEEFFSRRLCAFLKNNLNEKLSTHLFKKLLYM